MRLEDMKFRDPDTSAALRSTGAAILAILDYVKGREEVARLSCELVHDNIRGQYFEGKEAAYRSVVRYVEDHLKTLLVPVEHHVRLLCCICGKQAVKGQVPSKNDKRITKTEGCRAGFGNYGPGTRLIFCGYCADDLDENGNFPEESEGYL